MSPETKKLLDIYLALRETLMPEGKRFSELSQGAKDDLNTAWRDFSDRIGEPHLAVALYDAEKARRDRDRA